MFLRRGALALLLVITLSGPALAAKPVRGCPQPFQQMGYQAFRSLSLSVGVPESLLGSEHQAGWQTRDRNDDGDLCVMDLPDTPGTLDGWVFNVVDNTANP